MLSTTNTINDMKTKLGNGFAFYGFADDPTFVAALTDSVDNNKFDAMYPALATLGNSVDVGVVNTTLVPVTRSNNMEYGKILYDEIATKDKVSLTLFEEYVYWAEIWCSMSDFMSGLSENSNFSITGSSQTITTEGYSSTVSGTSDESGKEDIANNYSIKGSGFLVKAGLVVNARPRSGR